MSTVSLIKEAQKAFQDKDYIQTYEICTKALTSDSSPPLPLLLLHGNCAIQIEKWEASEKSFIDALAADKAGQYHQKIWKSLSEIYEKTGNWKKLSEALLHLLDFTKEKGNLDRSIVLAENIASTYEKSCDYLKGAEFVCSHLHEFKLKYTGHNMAMLSILRCLRDSYGEASRRTKYASIGSKSSLPTDSCLLDGDVLENAQLVDIALHSLDMVLAELPLERLQDSSTVDVVQLLVDHMLKSRSQVIFKSKSVDIYDVYKHATCLVRSFQPLTACLVDIEFSSLTATAMKVCTGVLTAQAFLVECWFLLGDVKFCDISDHLESALRLCALYSSFSTEIPVEFPDISMSADILVCLLMSCKAMNAMEGGYLRETASFGTQCAASWKHAVSTHMEMTTSARESTLNASSASTAQLGATYLNATGTMARTLCLLACASVGSVVRFRGEALGGLSVGESLYLTQHAMSAVSALRRIFPPEFVNPLRAVIRELVPLSRVRSLECVNQAEACVVECMSIELLELSDKSSALVAAELTVDPIARKYKKQLLHREEMYVASAEYIARPLHPVSQWVYVSILSDIGLHSEAQRCVDTFLSRSLPVRSSWLQAERAWSVLMHAVKSTTSTDSPPAVDDILSSLNLLKNKTVSESTAVSVISALSAALSSTDEFHIEIEAEIKYRIGVAMWLAGGTMRSEKSKCIAMLLAAAKLSPNFGSVYSFIGHYYHTQVKDINRAVKCYLKALAYNPMDSEAGVSLSQLYIETGDVIQATKLWNQVNTLTASHCSWSYVLAGQLHMILEEYESAIDTFQKALELDANNSCCWFGLGESYSWLDQNTAALKSFQRACDVATSQGGSTVPVLCPMAEVERRLCMLPQALEHFESASTAAGDTDPVALQGIAEVCLAMAYDRQTYGWTRGAARSVMEGLRAIEKFVRCYEGNADSVPPCIMKLKGDLCCFGRYLSPFDMKDSCDNNSNNITCSMYEDILDMLKKGEVAYQSVLSRIAAGAQTPSEQTESDVYIPVTEDVVAAWYDLGYALYLQALMEITAMGQGSGICSSQRLLESARIDTTTTPLGTFQRAMTAFISGLEAGEFPDHSGCWNGIGLCVRQHDALREMCFVCAAELEANPAAYANAGLLLVQHGLYKEARQCMSAVQLMESNPLHWMTLGALIEKETASTPPSDEKELMLAKIQQYDAYSAALEVAKPPDALLGIAISWMRLKGILTPDNKIQDTFSTVHLNCVTAVEVRFAVERPLRSFLETRPLHPVAWALLGWSYTFRGAWDMALSAYKKGVDALDVILVNMDASRLRISDEEKAYAETSVDTIAKHILSGIDMCHGMRRASLSDESFTDATDAHSLETSSLRKRVLGATDNVSRERNQISTPIQCCMNRDFIESAQKIWQAVEICLSDSDVMGLLEHIDLAARFETLVTEKNKCYFSELLLRVGGMVCESVQVNEDASPTLKLLIDALSRSANAVVTVSKALVKHNRKEDASIVLKYFMSTHGNNVEILLLLASIDEDMLESCSCDALSLTSKLLVSSVDMEDFSSECPLLCNHNSRNLSTECLCKEISLRKMDTVVPGYCDAVCLRTVSKSRNGVRSDETTKRYLLKAAFYDPSNAAVWSALAGQMYSDAVLGNKYSPEYEQAVCSTPEERHEIELPAPTCGCFSDDSYLSLCSTIIDFVEAKHSSYVSFLTSSRDQLRSLVSDSSTRSPDISTARKLFAECDYAKAISAYETCIAQSNSAAYTAMLSIEIGQVYSCSRDASSAEKYFMTAHELYGSMTDRSTESTHLLQGRCLVLSSIAYLRRYQHSRDIDDANRAKAIVLSISESNHGASVHAAALGVRAAVWICQGKAKKAASDIEQAKATWPMIELPLFTTVVT